MLCTVCGDKIGDTRLCVLCHNNVALCETCYNLHLKREAGNGDTIRQPELPTVPTGRTATDDAVGRP